MGVLYGDNPEKMKDLVRASTRITHTDPKAEFGAMAVALAAYMAGNQEFSPHEYYKKLELLLGTGAEEFLLLVKKALDSYGSGKTTEHFAETLGLGKGVSGYIYHTVPVVLYGWFKNSGDFSDGLKEIIRCGGDTDTTGAIFGAITGAGVGKEGIPEDWIDNIMEWPMTVKWIEETGKKLSELYVSKKKGAPKNLNFFSVFLRNIFFMLLVLFHGFRRLFPPY